MYNEAGPPGAASSQRKLCPARRLKQHDPLESASGRKAGTKSRDACTRSQAQAKLRQALPRIGELTLPRKGACLAAMVECSLISKPQYCHLRALKRSGTDGVEMQVVCKKTDGNAETHCCVCGQGFVMFWDRQSRNERIAALHEIQEAFRPQHRNAAGPEAHPKDSFPVPEWSGASAFSGTAAQGIAVPGKAHTLDL